MAEVRYDEYFGSEEHIGSIPDNKEEFVRMTMKRVSFTMHDPMIRKIRRFLATEFTAPAVLLIAKADRQPQYEEEILKSIEKHIRHFCDVYMKK